MDNNRLDLEKKDALGVRLREFRRAKRMKQRELATLCDVSPAYIGLIETGKRAPDGNLLHKLCSKLKLSVTEEAELRGRPRNIEGILSGALRELNGKSTTFYVRDPFWPDELRLVQMLGVKRLEPMHGFVSPEGTKRVLLDGDDNSFCADAQNAADRRDSLAKLPAAIPADKRGLFGDFVEREEIKSSARLLFRGQAGAVRAVLFVNFDKPNEVGGEMPRQKETEQKILRLRDVLSSELMTEIENALYLEDAPILQHAISILRPLQGLAAYIVERQDTLEQYLSVLLDAAMAAVGLDPDKGLGTVHLYRSDKEVLELVAHRGSFGDLGRARKQSVLQGDGIISWVFLKQRAIVIEDLPTSPFSAIHVKIREGIRSELAVPIYAGKSVIGVLNLEAIEPRQFKSTHARALWYAASNAAVAVRLYGQVELNRKLAELNENLLSLFCPPENAIKNLPHVAAATLGATRCGVWRYDPERSDPFYSPGATYPLDSDGPRKRGWSEYVCRTGSIVWISSIRSPTDFHVSFWNARSRVWESRTAKPGAPKSLNQSVVSANIDSELGLPILIDNECVGVAWLKFDLSARPRPDEAEMRLAESLSKGAARGLKSLPVQLPANSAIRH